MFFFQNSKKRVLTFFLELSLLTFSRTPRRCAVLREHDGQPDTVQRAVAQVPAGVHDDAVQRVHGRRHEAAAPARRLRRLHRLLLDDRRHRARQHQPHVGRRRLRDGRDHADQKAGGRRGAPADAAGGDGARRVGDDRAVVIRRPVAASVHAGRPVPTQRPRQRGRRRRRHASRRRPTDEGVRRRRGGRRRPVAYRRAPAVAVQAHQPRPSACRRQRPQSDGKRRIKRQIAARAAIVSGGFRTIFGKPLPTPYREVLFLE